MASAKSQVVKAVVFLGGTLLLLVVAFRIAAPYFRSDSEKKYDAEMDAAREKIGPGLDAILDDLDDSGHRVKIAVHFTHDGVGKDYPDYGCGDGFEAAFAEALGAKDLVSFDSGLIGGKDRKLSIDATMTPSDRVYRLAYSNTPHPSIVLAGKLTLDGRVLPFKVEPPANFEYTEVRMSFDIGRSRDEDVPKAIVGGACKEIAYALIESRTKWRRPAPAPEPAKSDPY